jgi:hypothetical protein
MHMVEVYVLVNTQTGDFVVGKDRDLLAQAYADEIGDDLMHSRTTKLTLQVPLADDDELSGELLREVCKSRLTVE